MSKRPLDDADIEALAEAICMDTVNTIQQEGGSEELEVALNFLAMYVSHLVFFALTNYPNNASDKVKEDYSFQSYQNMKANIQGAIGVGFKGAMEQFSGRHASYYCMIQPVPEPVNKEPC